MITKYGLKYTLGAILKRGPIIFRKKITLVRVGVTYGCQCNCTHCAMEGYTKKGKELSTDEIKRLLDKLFLLNVRAIKFFGGEPLLRKDIFELISYASPKMLTLLVTNGILLTPKNIKKLKEAGLTTLQVSIDSPLAEVHDKQRRKKCFGKATRGVKLAREIDIPYRIVSACPSGDMLSYLDELVNLCKKIGATSLQIVKPVRLGKLINKDVQLTMLEERKLLDLAKDPFVSLEPSTCLAHKKKGFYVSPYGEVQPCSFVPHSFGNIRDEQIGTIIKRMWKHKMFNIKRNPRECVINNKEFREKYLKNK